MGATLVATSDEDGAPLITIMIFSQIVLPMLVLPLMLMGFMRALAEAVAFSLAASVTAVALTWLRGGSESLFLVGFGLSALEFALLVSPLLLLGRLIDRGEHIR